jgi:hypothetical protein
LLLEQLRNLDRDRQSELIAELFTKGDSSERASVLRLLPALPEPERFVSVAVEACRTHVRDVFEAIACENPYPADHFSELAFNQMVLKALFLEVPLARIEGLARRKNSELARMADAYRSEREAAGRSVPADVREIQP